MNKTKSLIFIATLLVLLLGLTVISASDVSNDTTQTLEKQSLQTSTDSVKEPIKSIKKEETSMDYYVSDNSGSDSNSGTNDSPFKTIQTALDKTTSECTYNIHIAEGTYKGLGNTNLTVNGDYFINFIGDGMNKTIFDGEADYKFHESGENDFYWGSSKFWEPYDNCTGNWLMNVTSGQGKISITNLTIQNCMNPGFNGGANIGLYNTSTVNNYGNLSINYVYFKDNLGGVGAATRNHENATIHINNSIFEGNRKSVSMGNFGAGLYNNGTALVENSLFYKNAARWGTVTSDGNLTMINCTLKDNIGYDGSSTYKYGAGIAVDTGKADYYQPYVMENVNTVILNSTFINNQMTDIYVANSSLVVDGCLFNASTGIFLADGNNTLVTQNITNNNFVNMSYSSIGLSLTVTAMATTAINSLGSYKLLIENNTISTNEGANCVAIHVTDNATIVNNVLYDKVEIYGDFNTVDNNTIYGSVGGTSRLVKNNTVTNNWIHDNVNYGDRAVDSNLKNRLNVVENNIPILGRDYNISNENFYEYFDDNNNLIKDNVEEGSRVYLRNLTDKDLIIEDRNIAITSYTGDVQTNISITTNNNAIVVISGLDIRDYDARDYVIQLNSTNNVVSGCHIYTSNIRTPVIVNKDYNSINSIEVSMVDEESLNDEITAVQFNSSHNAISGIFNITSADKVVAIKVLNAETTKIGASTVNINSTNDAVGLLIKNSQNIITGVDNNVLTLNIGSTGDVEAIKIEDSSKCDFRNSPTLNIDSDGDVIGIHVKSEQGEGNIVIYSLLGNINSDKATVIRFNNTKNNYLQTTILQNLIVNAHEIIGLHLINTTNTTYALNLSLNSDENNTTSILLENSDNNKFNKVIYTNNTLIVLNSSNNNTISLVNNITSQNSSILLYDSDDNIITNNTITTQSPYTMELTNSNNNKIFNNNLISNDKIGDETVKLTSSTANTIENNTRITVITMDNYDTYFNENSEFDQAFITSVIELGSDFYNKSFTFNGSYNITNPHNYTIYNGSITLNGQKASILNLKINTTNTSTVLTANTTTFSLTNTTIFHENNDITRTVVLTNNVNAKLIGFNITTIGPEIATNDGTPSTIAVYDNSNYTYLDIPVTYGGMNANFKWSYVTVISNREEDGYLAGYYSNEKGLLQVMSGGTSNDGYFVLPIMNLRGKNVTGIYLDKKTYNSSVIHSAVVYNFDCSIEADSGTPVILKNSENNRLVYVNLTTNQRYNIILENVTNSNITNNNLNSSNTYFADNSIQIIDSTDNLIENNTPYVYDITDENYADYFNEDATFKPFLSSSTQLLNVIRIASDLHNKSMIFDKTVKIENEELEHCRVLGIPKLLIREIKDYKEITAYSAQ